MARKAWRPLFDVLLKSLGTKLHERYGFDPKAKYQKFRKRTDSGYWNITLTFIPHADDFDVVIELVGRIDKVQEPLDVVDEKLRVWRWEKGQSSTFGTELGKAAGDKLSWRWTLVSPEDVEPAAEGMMVALRDVGIPYLEKYSDLNNLLQECLGEDFANKVLPLRFSRMLNAMPAALLLGKKDLFENIVMQRDHICTKTREIEIFDCLVNVLRTKWI